MNFRINYIWTAILALAIFACDPLEDVYEEIDAQKSDAATADLNFKLTEEDYELAGPYIDNGADSVDLLTYNSFSSEDQVKKYVPIILNEKYPHLGLGSFAVVAYDFYRGSNPMVTEYTTATQYELTNSDYESLGGDAETFYVLSKDQSPISILPGILNANIQDPVEGQIVLAQYDYVDVVDAPEPVTVFKEVTDEDVSGYTDVDKTMAESDYQMLVDYTQSVRGDDWIDSFGTLEYYFGANSFFENFDARVDEVNNGSTNNRKNWISDNGLDDDIFEGSSNYSEDSARVEDRIREGILQYLSLAYPQAKASEQKVYNVTFLVFYGDMGSGFVDETYTFSAIVDPDEEGESSLETDSRGDFYVFEDGNWELDESAIYLSSSDYDAMGAPGRFDNFSSSTPADDYLPTFLSTSYPYAQEEDELIIVYKYFSGSVQTRGDFYSVINSMWSKYESSVESQLSFAHDGNVWVPDNTIKFSLSSEDINFIANWKGLDTGPGDNFATFGSFDVRSSSSNYWSQADILEAFNALLMEKYPDAEIGQKFLITYLIYDGSVKEQSMNVILTESGYVIDEE